MKFRTIIKQFFSGAIYKQFRLILELLIKSVLLDYSGAIYKSVLFRL